MPQILPYEYIEITAGGGTLNLTNDDYKSIYIAFGDTTLTSSWTVQLNGEETPTVGTVFQFIYNATIVLNGNSITFFGKDIDNFADKVCKITCVYGFDADFGDNKWNVIVSPDFEGVGFIETEDIADSAVTTAKLAANAVTTVKITDANVTVSKLATDSVTTVKIVDANVTAAKLASDAVTTVKILDANVTTTKIADSNVTTAKIADSNITTAKINDSAVTTGKVADLAITGAKLADTTITVGKIASNAVTNVKVLADTLQPSKSTQLARTEVITAFVSFETAEQGTYKVYCPYKGNVTSAAFSVTKALSNTDDGSIILRNDAGTVMTGGTLTVPLSSAIGTNIEVSPSANNAVDPGDYIQMVISKTTVGGKGTIFIGIERQDS